MKKHNFYAGPSILSEYTIKNTAEAILNFADTGLSLLEVSHRSKEFTAVIDEIYEKYKNGETIYLECYCGVGDGIKKNCHGEVIAEKLQKRLLRERIKEVKNKLNDR